jgi:3-oxoacyl-[acyl-carrier protein] reductase
MDTHCSDEAIALSGDLATTRAAADSSHAMDNTARPEKVAQAAVFLASDASSLVTGVPLFADGGFMIKK